MSFPAANEKEAGIQPPASVIKRGGLLTSSPALGTSPGTLREAPERAGRGWGGGKKPKYFLEKSIHECLKYFKIDRKVYKK